jgi:hypothetical protein
MTLDAGDNVFPKGTPLSPSATPTPHRFHKIDDNNVTTEYSDDYEITREVMDILKDVPLQDEITTTLRQELNRYALKSLGFVKGRDITRVAIKSKDTKIAELQKRIAELEAERARDKDIICRIKSDIAENFSKHSHGGRRGGFAAYGGG